MKTYYQTLYTALMYCFSVVGAIGVALSIVFVLFFPEAARPNSFNSAFGAGMASLIYMLRSIATHSYVYALMSLALLIVMVNAIAGITNYYYAGLVYAAYTFFFWTEATRERNS